MSDQGPDGGVKEGQKSMGFFRQEGLFAENQPDEASGRVRAGDGIYMAGGRGREAGLQCVWACVYVQVCMNSSGN